ncbi:MAG: discoidin domain-containing protein [Lentimonas sp.]
MALSKPLRTSVLALSGITIVFLLIAAAWTKSAEFDELSPLLEVSGNMHPLFLHLPIGVFIYLGIAEVWNLLVSPFSKRAQIPGAFPILLFGTFFAVLAAVAGLLLYLQGDYSGELINRHLNWGIGFAIAAIIVFCCAVIFTVDSALYSLTLLGSIAVLWFAAHKGGLITHGDPLKPLFAEAEVIEEAKPVETLITYEVVDKIFESKCYSCHAVDTKQKSGLLMDSYDALLVGGDTGPALVPGDLRESLISDYSHLPLDDDLHMPPEGKPQLTEMELAFIDQWILAGASPDARLADLEFPDELYNWAIAYMQIDSESSEDEVTVVEMPALPVVDFSKLISGIERYAENSVMRIGEKGDQLLFSAVNARQQFGDQAIVELVKAGQFLTDIDLSNTQVSSSGIQTLTQATSKLKRLNLSGTAVDQNVLENLKQLKDLESLVLFNTSLTAETLASLGELKQLDALYLAQSGLSPEQIAKIRNALPDTEVVADDFLDKNTPAPVASDTPEPKVEETAERGDNSGDILNLAFEKPVSASSYYNVGGESFPASNVTDGRLADTGSPKNWSFWLAQNGDSGAVTIDLEEVHEISRIDLQNTRNRQYADRGIKNFTIEVSTDGSTFEEVTRGTLKRIEQQSPNYYAFETFAFQKTTARFVRINGLTNYVPDNGRHKGSGGLNEVRIFNDPSAKHKHSHGEHGHDHGHTHDDAPPASIESHITGNDAYRFKSDPNWAKLTDGNPIGATHGGIAISKTGEVYVSTDSPRSIMVFDAAGNFLRSFPEQFGGIHSLLMREEDGVEYLYCAHKWGDRLLKLDTQGNIILEINHTEENPIPGTLKGITAVTVGPDGRIYAAIGYGSNHMHIFSPDGELLKTVGSKGAANDQTERNHGLTIDTRFSPARILVADRENLRLVHYDLEGNFIEVHTTGLRRPCSMSIYGDICAVAELAGRVTLLEKSGNIAAHLGDNPNRDQWAKFDTQLQDLAPNIFSAPHGIAFDADGDIYVQDWNKTGRLTKLIRN